MSDSSGPVERTVSGCTKCGGPLHGSVTGVCPVCAVGGQTPVTAPPEAPLPDGTSFRGMVIEGVLGRGGMGVVYKARQPGLDRHVALKILPQALSADPEFVKRFLREGKAMASLSHPNIVAIYDFGQEGDRHFIVMEFVDGVNLRTLLRQKAITAAQALAIVPQVCDALQFAHGEGVVHRDIKPENILLDRKGRVKIADFGLAKVFGDQSRAEALTITNMVMGTPNYMAPEQLENPKAVDHRADIYSFGVVIYEMLTGELPVGRFDPPSKRAPLDARLDEVVMRALEKQTDRRYQDAGQIRADVTRITGAVPAFAARGLTGAVFALGAAVIVLFGLLVAVLVRRGPDPVATAVPTAGTSSPLPTPTPTPEADLFALTALKEKDVPAGLSFTDAALATEDPAAILKRTADWGLELGEAVSKVRRLRHERVGLDRRTGLDVWTFGMADEESAAAISRALLEKFKQGDVGLVSKGRTVCFLWAGWQRPVRLSLAQNRMEDLVRSRWGVEPAQRRGAALMIAEDLPSGWKRTKAPRTDLDEVAREAERWTKVERELLWDGEISAWGPDAEPEAVRLISLRFVESEPAQQWVVQARSVGEPEGVRRAVLLEEGHRTGALVLVGSSREAAEGFDHIARRLAERVDRGSGVRLKPVARVDSVKIGEKEIELAFNLMGVSIRNLKERGRWDFELDMHPVYDLKWSSAPPEGMTLEKFVLKVPLRITVTDLLARAFEIGGDDFTLEIRFDGPEIAEPIKLQVKWDPTTLPKIFRGGLADVRMDPVDLPSGWQFQWRAPNNQHYPIWGAETDDLAHVARELQGLGAVAPEAMRTAVVYAFEPKEKFPKAANFEHLRMALVHVAEGEAGASVIERLKAAKEMRGATRFQFIPGTRFFGVVYLRGTEPAAVEAFEAVAKVASRQLAGR